MNISLVVTWTFAWTFAWRGQLNISTRFEPEPVSVRIILYFPVIIDIQNGVLHVYIKDWLNLEGSVFEFESLPSPTPAVPTPTNIWYPDSTASCTEMSYLPIKCFISEISSHPQENFQKNNPTDKVSLSNHLKVSHRARPMPAHRYVEEKGSATGCQEFHRECVTCMLLLSTNKAVHSGFETQRRHHQKFKTGVSVATQKGFMSSKNFWKKNKKEESMKTQFAPGRPSL